MRLLNSAAHVYGFEEYNVVYILSNIFKQEWTYTLPYIFNAVSGNYILTKDLPVKVTQESGGSYYYYKVVFTPTLCHNHRELLDTAKKVYTHPSCKLSRSMMAEKYKKSLNPYFSDAVVIPTPNYDDLTLNTDAFYINEDAKMIVMVRVDTDDEETVRKVDSFQDGDTLASHITCALQTSSWHSTAYTIQDVLNSKFMYQGQALFIPHTKSYIADILTSTIPTDKIVYEESIQESLSSEFNQLTFDSLVSIGDMLESSDENTVAAGLKALSMMDWMHYPNSVRFMLRHADSNRWVYNKASNSTSVKFMFCSLSGNRTNRRYWPGNYDNEIYEQDYELFKQLKEYYDKSSKDGVLNNMKQYEFMTISSTGVLMPNLRKVAV